MKPFSRKNRVLTISNRNLDTLVLLWRAKYMKPPYEYVSGIEYRFIWKKLAFMYCFKVRKMDKFEELF